MCHQKLYSVDLLDVIDLIKANVLVKRIAACNGGYVSQLMWRSIWNLYKEDYILAEIFPFCVSMCASVCNLL